MTWRPSPRCVQTITSSRSSRWPAAKDLSFAVIEPVIDDRRGATGKYFAGPREVQTAMAECEIALGWIEADPQRIVPPINVKGNVATLEYPGRVTRVSVDSTKSGAASPPIQGFALAIQELLLLLPNRE